MKRLLYALLMCAVGVMFMINSHTDLQSLVFSSGVFAFFSFPLAFCIARERLLKRNI